MAWMEWNARARSIAGLHRAPPARVRARLLRRAVYVFAASAALAALFIDSNANDGAVHAAPVTAEPPLEAEATAPPKHPKAKSHLRQCEADARAKHLHGRDRDAYLHSCMGVHSTTAHSARVSRPLHAATSSSGSRVSRFTRFSRSAGTSSASSPSSASSAASASRASAAAH